MVGGQAVNTDRLQGEFATWLKKAAGESGFCGIPSGRWPAIYCCRAFLVRTRDGIAPMAAQFSDVRLRRRRRSRRHRPCLVRMAVSARADLGVMPGLGWVVIRHL